MEVLEKTRFHNNSGSDRRTINNRPGGRSILNATKLGRQEMVQRRTRKTQGVRRDKRFIGGTIKQSQGRNPENSLREGDQA